MSIASLRLRVALLAGMPYLCSAPTFAVEGTLPSSRANYFGKLLNDTKADKVHRLLALQRLQATSLDRKEVVKALEKAAKDPDVDIKEGAASLLRTRAAGGN